MSQQQQGRRPFRGARIGDFIPQDQLEKIREYALAPQSLEDKLILFNKMVVEHEVPHPKDPTKKDHRSKLGSFINRLFYTQMKLPIIGRRQQIGKAVKYAREYLKDNPHASIYFAAAMGAAEEYREWMATVGDLTPTQQEIVMDVEKENEPAGGTA